MEYLHSHVLEVVLGGLLVLEQYLAKSNVIAANSTSELIENILKGAIGLLFPPKA
jgi:hypothetical protein